MSFHSKMFVEQPGSAGCGKYGEKFSRKFVKHPNFNNVGYVGKSMPSALFQKWLNKFMLSKITKHTQWPFWKNAWRQYVCLRCRITHNFSITFKRKIFFIIIYGFSQKVVFSQWYVLFNQFLTLPTCLHCQYNDFHLKKNVYNMF